MRETGRRTAELPDSAGLAPGPLTTLAGRHGHFFPARLLQSQLADLQMPDDAERTFVVLAVHSPDEIADEIMRRLGLTGTDG